MRRRGRCTRSAWGCGEREGQPVIPDRVPGDRSPTSYQERAARLFGTAQALREAIGAPLPPVERAEHECHLAAARAALGEAAFTLAWMAGRAMSLDQAIDTAMQER